MKINKYMLNFNLGMAKWVGWYFQLFPIGIGFKSESRYKHAFRCWGATKCRRRNDQVVGFRNGSFPLDYLGMPIGANIRLIRNSNQVMEKLYKRLSTWKVKSLSFGGRLTLVKYVLGSSPLYFLSLFHAPTSVLISKAS